MRQMRGNPLYETADLHQPGVTHRLDITRVPLPDASYDVVMAHQYWTHRRRCAGDARTVQVVEAGRCRCAERADQCVSSTDL